MAEDEGRKDEDAGSGEDSDDDGEEEWTPPTKEEWARLTNTAKVRKTEKQELQRQLTELKDAAKKKDDTDDSEVKKEVSAWKSRALTNAATAALTSAGFSGDQAAAKKLAKLMDLETAEPDKSGDFDFSDEVAELKKEYPALFAEKDERQPRRKPTTTDRNGGRGAKKDATSERLMRSAGY